MDLDKRLKELTKSLKKDKIDDLSTKSDKPITDITKNKKLTGEAKKCPKTSPKETRKTENWRQYARDYYYKNREKLNEKHRIWWSENKEKINKKRRQK